MVSMSAEKTSLSESNRVHQRSKSLTTKTSRCRSAMVTAVNSKLTKDGCDETLIDGVSWREAVEAVKQNDWKFEKVDGEWEHYCPTCQWRK